MNETVIRLTIFYIVVMISEFFYHNNIRMRTPDSVPASLYLHFCNRYNYFSYYSTVFNV